MHPVSILAALPLTIPFAVLSLILLRTSLDVFAMLGLFMLFGIVKRTASCRSTRRTSSAPLAWGRDEAILAANRTRLRRSS